MNNYPFLTQILHKQFLSNENIINFQLNKLKKNSKRINFKKYKNLFITGLARSGSTALLQSIDETNKFASLRYKYMPFILSPKIAKFYSKYFSNNQNLEQERLHGDGLKISSNSPECLEEPYWMNTIYKSFNINASLKPHKISLDAMNGYCQLLDSYLKIEKKKQFLIKNNNHHLRIISLASYLPNSTFLILIRNPISHAKSLLNAHKRFTDIQNKNKFVLQYMNLIGHWEFGKGKKSFIYKKGQEKKLEILDEFKIEYWFQQWIYTYEWILEIISKKGQEKQTNLKIVCYEDLCSNKNYKENLFKKLSVKKYKFEFNIGKSNLSANKEIIDKSKVEKAFYIYKQLRNKSLQYLEIKI